MFDPIGSFYFESVQLDPNFGRIDSIKFMALNSIDGVNFLAMWHTDCAIFNDMVESEYCFRQSLFKLHLDNIVLFYLPRGNRTIRSDLEFSNPFVEQLESFTGKAISRKSEIHREDIAICKDYSVPYKVLYLVLTYNYFELDCVRRR